MSNRYMDGDAAAEMLERSWFAAYKRAEVLRSECDVLREAAVVAEVAWRRASTELAELEALRDVLGDQLSCTNYFYSEVEPQQVHRTVMSAA
jgi:hypothetical protein